MASIPEDTRITVDYVEENLTNPWESLSLAVIDEADEADVTVSDNDVIGSATSEEEVAEEVAEEAAVGVDADNIEQTHREFMRQFCIDMSVGFNNANCNIPNSATMVFRTESSKQFQVSFCPDCGNYVIDSSDTLRNLGYYSQPNITCNEVLHFIPTELIMLDNSIEMFTQKINGVYFGDNAENATQIKILSTEIEILRLKKQICTLRLDIINS